LCQKGIAITDVCVQKTKLAESFVVLDKIIIPINLSSPVSLSPKKPDTL